MAASDDFTHLVDPFRGELLAHCYRMLGSADEAEDLVQETYLRAWRSYDGFEGRSSLRTWLYRIATNACLTAIERQGRRPMPSGLGAPLEGPQSQMPGQADDVPWLTPVPDALVGPVADDPAAIAGTRDSLRLALIAAWQFLPARQRAVLILRDVLDWPAAEVADLLGMTTTAVNSALRRARARLAEVAPAEADVSLPSGHSVRALLDRYLLAFERADMKELARLLREDAVLEMPPVPAWFSGRDDVVHFYRMHVLTEPNLHRLVRTAANGQPAVAVYRRGPGDRFEAHAIQVLSVTAAQISRIDTFLDTRLFSMFGLPTVYPADAASGPAVDADGSWRGRS
jgi:RNA polymerase sigma-70 factor (ECF subfamily)